MSVRYDCTDPSQRAVGISAATAALRGGQLAVFPTDTAYGLAADAFSPAAVAALLSTRGGGRHAPPAVLTGTVRAALALVQDDVMETHGKDLIDAFWPGPLTLVVRANRSLSWDLGETLGTVAVRIPLHPLALDLLKATGPLACSSANHTATPPATTAAQAEEQLGSAVAVYLDDGPCPGEPLSTVVDLTAPLPRLMRRGALPLDRLREVVPLLMDGTAPED
ncbi:MAG TPA: L-threonylcarbamoyladenylate synthase, partial [Streptosporangiaceae bacterium]|nr:L-threonylcarbamoyladenylate synthase [Streptosporangiaceae bacterium]